MHRVHHFDTSEAAYEASLNEWDVREGDVLVIEAERVVGLGSTDPIAITVVAGALKTIVAMTRDELLAELVHGAPEIGYAVDEALRHGWPVAPHYLGFAGPHRCIPSSKAAVTLTLDDVAVTLDAIDHRIATLTERSATTDAQSSHGLFLAQGLSRLPDARSRIGGYTKTS